MNDTTASNSTYIIDTSLPTVVWLAIILDQYAAIILIVMGIVTNSYNLVALTRLSVGTTPPLIYLTLLGALDILVLCIRSGNVWYRSVFGISLQDQLIVKTDSACEVFHFITSAIFHASEWILVIPFIELALVTSSPEKAHKICTWERTKHSLLLLTLAICCLNGHFFFTYSVISPEDLGLEPGPNLCTFTPGGDYSSDKFRDHIWPITNLLVVTLLPWISIIVCCSIIRCRSAHFKDKLRKSRIIYVDDMVILRRVFLILGVAHTVTQAPASAYEFYEFIVGTYLSQSYSCSVSCEDARYLWSSASATLKDLFRSSKIILYYILLVKFRIPAQLAYCKKKKSRTVMAQTASSRENLFAVSVNVNNTEEENCLL